MNDGMPDSLTGDWTPNWYDDFRDFRHAAEQRGTLPETNREASVNRPLEVWRFLLETSIFRGELLVSGRVSTEYFFASWMTVSIGETGRPMW